MFAAFDSGELDKNKFKFAVDNDGVYLEYLDDDMDIGEAHKYALSLFSSGVAIKMSLNY